MRVQTTWPQSSALLRRLAEVRASALPGGRANTRALGDIRRIVIDDHVDKMLRGVDRYGRPRAALALSTLRGGRGPGPSLVPHGMASRFITNFDASWQRTSGSASTLTMRYRDLPFARFHESGATRPGTRWVLPPRPTMGITPAGWARVRARMSRFASEALKDT